MKEREATAAGFHFTGICSRAWDVEEWEKCKTRADDIKKKWKGADYRIVSKSCEALRGKVPWKNIYGNEIFRAVQYIDDKTLEAKANYVSDEAFQKRLANLEAEYKQRVEHEKELYENAKKEYEELIALRK